MTPEAQRIAIAEACGWHKHKTFYTDGSVASEGWCDPGKVGRNLPDYLNDLNAMHRAEELLSAAQTVEYEDAISMVQITAFEKDATSGLWASWHATAAHRAEAFLRTIGKWTS